MRVFTILKGMAHKLGLIGDYVVETGKDGIWTYQKWASGIVRLWGTYSGTIASYATSHWQIPLQKYPFDVYDPHDAACAHVNNGVGIFGYFLDNTSGWSGVINTLDMSTSFPKGTNATITAKIQVTGFWKDFEGGGST